MGTWKQVAAMPMPQIKLLMAACDKRYAAQNLESLQGTHAALAPLLAGDKGTPVYQSVLSRLMRIIRPAKKQQAASDTPFSRLAAAVRAQSKN